MTSRLRRARDSALVVLVAVLLVSGCVRGSPSGVVDDAITTTSVSRDYVLPYDATRLLTVPRPSGRSGASLVSVTITPELHSPQDADRAVYLVVTLACGAPGAPLIASASGTENVLQRGNGAFVLSVALPASGDAADQRCSVKTSAPNWDPKRERSTLTMRAEVQWSGPLSQAQQISAESARPFILESGTAATVIDADVPVHGAHPDDILAAATAHITSCVMRGGSKDGNDNNLCADSMIDTYGATVKVRSTVVLVNGSQPCAQLSLLAIDERISYERHHMLVGAPMQAVSGGSGCTATRAHLRMTVDNEGPAAVIVHRRSTSLIVGRR